MHFSEEKTIPGLEQTISSYTDESCRSLWIGEPQFWIASIFALTWPYRWLFRLRTAHSSFVITKVLYRTRPEAQGSVEAYKDSDVEDTDVNVNIESSTTITIDLHM